MWKELLEGVVVLPGFDSDRPGSTDQIPDTFVYLCKGSESAANRRICYARFSTLDLIAHGFTQPMAWHRLRADPAINDIPKDQFPGSLLFRMGLADPASPVIPGADSWAHDMTQLEILTPYQLRVRPQSPHTPHALS